MSYKKRKAFFRTEKSLQFRRNCSIILWHKTLGKIYEPTKTTMNKPFSFYSGLILLLLIAFQTAAQKQNESFDQMKNLIESKKFEFTADQMLPSSGPSKYLIPENYYLIIQSTKATASLPYYGEAYNSPYGEGGGIEFEGAYTDYTTSINEKKERIKVKFKVRGEHDTYQCNLSVSKNGSATLSVISNNRQNISYWGNVDTLKKSPEN
mgnify:CR=1 FL=1